MRTQVLDLQYICHSPPAQEPSPNRTHTWILRILRAAMIDLRVRKWINWRQCSEEGHEPPPTSLEIRPVGLDAKALTIKWLT